MKKIIFIFLLTIFTSFSQARSLEKKPFYTSLAMGKIRVGEKIPKDILLNKNIKYFSNNEKAYLINKSYTEIIILDFCCGGFGEVQRIKVLPIKSKIMHKQQLNVSNISSFY